MDLTEYFGGGFPLTIERLEFLQNSYLKGFKAISSVFGAGSDGHVVLDGGYDFNWTQDGQRYVTDGILVVDDEIIELKTGRLYDNFRLYLFEDIVYLPYNEDLNNDGNLDEKPSEKVRYYKGSENGAGSTGQWISYSMLKRVPKLTEIIPVGTIVPFDGDINNLPNGWELYTGLEDRHIIGAGGSHSLNAVGGSEGVNIEASNLPALKVFGNTTSSGSHNHVHKDTYNIDSGSADDTRANSFTQTFGVEQLSSIDLYGSGNTDRNNKYARYVERRNFKAGEHSHFINFAVKDSSNNDLGQNKQPLNIEPKFKALNYIKFVGISL